MAGLLFNILLEITLKNIYNGRTSLHDTGRS